MRARGPLVALVLAAAGLTACGRGSAGPRHAEASFRAASPGSAADPTVRPARLVPEEVDESSTFGAEASGGERVLVKGLRLVTAPQGVLVAAADTLPMSPQITTALPERLGGGFLFVLGTSVWRADKWLAPAAPIFTSGMAVQAVVPGLDRVYLRGPAGFVALDGRTGKLLDRGPWPASPNVTSYAAADGWRAVAAADLRGTVATFDAGATWRTLDLALEPRAVVPTGDTLAVGGIEGARGEAWFEVRGDGSVARLAGAPREAKGIVIPAARPPSKPGPMPGWPGATPWPAPTPVPHVTVPKVAPRGSAAAAGASTIDPDDETTSPSGSGDGGDAALGVRLFGARPIAAAIEDGWPLTDGTAVVARDGALARVRLGDGALVEIAAGAFPLKPSRCHAVSLSRPRAPGAFGFVCGEPRGTTAIYAYDPSRGRVVELKRFDRPRVVSSSGNGGLVVRGGCAEDDATSTATKDIPYCVLGHDDTWREIRVRGDVVGERVVVLADGRIAVVSPPPSLDAPARLTLLDKGKAVTVPVTFPKVGADVARVLRMGLWLEGFEERRPGVVSGWVEAAGTMLGLEIASDGKATVGQYVRDLGLAFVSGRYGLGWSPSKRGYETTDGGMTWTSLELPEPLAPRSGHVSRRACGPVGCLASGWVRVGWGEPKKAPVPLPPPVARTGVPVTVPSLQMACEPMAGPPPAAPTPRPPTPRPPAARPTPTPPTRFGLGGVLAPSPGAIGSSELAAFYTQAGPPLRDGERGVSFDVGEQFGRGTRTGSLARVYAWGPKTGDWDTQGRWQVRWLSPFSGWTEAKASVATLPANPILDLTRGTASAFGYGGIAFGSGAFLLAPGDDAAHALLGMRRVSNRSELALFELEADRAAVEIRRADGEPFPEIESAVRMSGRWFVSATSPSAATAAHTAIFQIDGGVAREIARVPRVGLDQGRTGVARLARRSDGRALGLVVEGQRTPERDVVVRWVAPIDLETGVVSEPESLGYEDLGGMTLDACAEDTVGWVLDAALANTTVRLKVGATAGSLHSVQTRLRLTGTRACVERVSGMLDGQSAERAAALGRAGARVATPARPGEIVASVFAAQNRHPLRCTLTR